MIGVESLFGGLVLWGGGGSDDLRAVSTVAMSNGRNLEVLCVSGYMCLRRPAGTFVLNAVDSEVTEYIHMIRSCLFLGVRAIGNVPSASVLSGIAVHRHGIHHVLSFRPILTGPILPGSQRWCSLGILKLKGTWGVNSWDSRDGGYNAGLQISMRLRVRSWSGIFGVFRYTCQDWRRWKSVSLAHGQHIYAPF